MTDMESKEWVAEMPACTEVYAPHGEIGSTALWTAFDRQTIRDLVTRANATNAELTKVRAELCAALEWRPMETAPKDLDPRTSRPTVVVLLHSMYGLATVTCGHWQGCNWWTDQGWLTGEALGWYPLPEPPKDVEA
jgi:hypothetical protein